MIDKQWYKKQFTEPFHKRHEKQGQINNALRNINEFVYQCTWCNHKVNMWSMLIYHGMDKSDYYKFICSNCHMTFLSPKKKG